LEADVAVKEHQSVKVAETKERKKKASVPVKGPKRTKPDKKKVRKTAAPKEGYYPSTWTDKERAKEEHMMRMFVNVAYGKPVENAIPGYRAEPTVAGNSAGVGAGGSSRYSKPMSDEDVRFWDTDSEEDDFFLRV